MRWLALLLLAACAQKAAPPAPAGPPLVCVSFYPLQYFAERIGGDAVEVVNLLPIDADVVLWMPEDVAALQSADLIVLNGAGLERWPDLVFLPESRVVRTAAPFRAEWLRYETPHRHGPGEDSHRGLDGHTWLDPVLAKAQANEIRKALGRLLPQRSREFDARFAALAKDLDALDAAFRALPKRSYAASHPAYNYVAKRYGWTMDESAPRRLWESEPAETKTGKVPILFDPCEWPADEDYIARMRTNAKRLATR